jgi:hypothetical protein
MARKNTGGNNMKVKGIWSTREVFVDGKKLSPKKSQKVWNHSPDCFNWGYGGSGPAQLALALLLLKYPKDEAVRLHQEFKFKVIAALPQEDFEIEIGAPWFGKGEEKCWACGKKFKPGTERKMAITNDGQCVYVGPVCYGYIARAGEREGWQPPLGGPRLYPMEIER